MDKSVNAPTLYRLVAANGLDSDSVYILAQEEILLGRDPNLDLPILSPMISRRHLRLFRTNDGYSIEDLGSSNGTFLNGQRLTTPTPLHPGDQIRLGKTIFFTYEITKPEPAYAPSGTLLESRLPAAKQTSQGMQTIDFRLKNELNVGRDASNDVVLNSPTVSRFHAKIQRIGQRFHLRDLRSSNGVYINNHRIDGEAWLKPEDQVRIGPYRFVIRDQHVEQYDENSGMGMEAIHLNKWVRKDLNILNDISLVIQPREFVVVVGQSGGGKSTLLDALSGYRPASHGRVFVNGVDMYNHADTIRSEIGFVPQKDIIHMELTVYQTLDYAARLRMPSDTTPEERQQRIYEVLKDLDLLHRKDLTVGSLSGGQQKRVSIGMELLTRPGLFFLDEPTSGLDPATETALMQLLRRLADQGHTIVMVTHSTKNVNLADKVLFLARGGHLAWFGPPNEALEYFEQHRPESERRTERMEFDEIYNILEDSVRGSNEDWDRRYRETDSYYQYVVRPIGERRKGSQQYSTPPTTEHKARRGYHRTSPFRQLAVLFSRNLQILTRNRSSRTLLLLAPILVSMLDLLVAVLNGRQPFDQNAGNPSKAMVSLFLPAVYCLLVGSLTQMREIIKEEDIYRRERMVCLRITPYVLSKFGTALLFAFYHAGVYLFMHWLAFGILGGTGEILPVYLTLLFGSLAGMTLGLMASALAPNPASAPSVLLLLIVPNFILSGGISGFSVPPAISSFIGTHWTYRNLIITSGLTADAAADVCWELPEDVRTTMTIDQKHDFGCRCMGVDMFREGSCRYPGLSQFYTSAIDAPRPLEPEPIGSPPPQPVLPEQPIEPENKLDQAAMNEYLEKVKDWQAQVSQIQANYQTEMQTYQERMDTYQRDVTDYQKSLADWQGDREAAIRPAEASIEEFMDRYGWAFVNKNDPATYFSAITRGLMALSALIAGMFILILLVMKGKDRVR